MSELFNYDAKPFIAQAANNRRNNKQYVDEFLSLAETFHNPAGATFHYANGQTPLYGAGYYGGIDCSTYALMCLLGWSYSETPYPVGHVVYKDWVANTDHPWSMNCNDHKVSPYIDNREYTPEWRYACTMARWMVMQGWALDLSAGLADVQPGDIVFWAAKSSSTDQWVNPNWYMHISHVGIVKTRTAAPDTYEYQDGEGNTVTGTWDKTKYPYKHTVLEVTSSLKGAISNTEALPCVEKLFERSMDDPTDVYWSNLNTIACICRPDFGALCPAIPATAADVGAIPAPASPATGAFLVWNGSAWVAQTLSTWQGGNY